MAIDMKKMKAKYNQLKNKGGGGDGTFWKPQDGEQTIRIVPTTDGDPFKTFWFYYNLDSKPVLCPKRNFGDHSPVLDFASKLWNEGTPDSTKLAKDLFPKQRFYSPVIVRGEEDLGVRVWGYSKTVYEQLLALVLDPDYGDITDVNQGTDLTLHYGKPAGVLYPQTKINPKRKSSKLSTKGDKLVKEWLDSVPDFDKLFERKSTAEVQALLDQFMSKDDEVEEKEEVSKYSSGTNSQVDKTIKEFLSED